MKKLFATLWLLAGPYLAFSQESADLKLQKTDVIISKHIYGQFAEHLGRSIYDGFYRNGKIRMDIVKALKEIKVPNLRWPGGCFADQYHWRNGIGTKVSRPIGINTTWGMVPEDNSFGTHEFLELCSLIGCDPYLAGNVGTGNPQEMKDWIEYLNYGGKSTLSALRAKNGHPEPFKVPFWGVGNESWGCGGNMRPEYYADLYKQYETFCMSYPGAPLKKIAGGANIDDYNWTEVLMKNIPGRSMWGLSLHYYTFPSGRWEPRGKATDFNEAEYQTSIKQAKRIEEIVTKHSAIMDKYDKGKKVALVVDEWGVWADVEAGTNPSFMYQQNTLRDALVAGLTLNVFNNHAERVKMANLAQTVNVIQSVILTKGDQMLLTPTYHIFDLYKVHQDATLVKTDISHPDLNVSASRDAKGVVHVSIVNTSLTANVNVNLDSEVASGKILSSANVSDYNTFENKNKIVLKDFNAKGKTVQIPAKSVVMLTLN